MTTPSLENVLRKEEGPMRPDLRAPGLAHYAPAICLPAGRNKEDNAWWPFWEESPQIHEVYLQHGHILSEDLRKTHASSRGKIKEPL